MYLTIITDDYICSNKDTNIEIIIPLITIIPCGMSLICLISLMVYILVKLLFNKKIFVKNKWINIFIPKSSS